MVENTIYGIPSSAYVNGLIYNKEVFDKAGITDPPKTIDEFLESLTMIKSARMQFRFTRIMQPDGLCRRGSSIRLLR